MVAEPGAHNAPLGRRGEPEMRICLIYDCLFPYTVGGAERWYRNVGERLSAGGHEVTYLTLRQWDADTPPDLEGVEVVAVGPRMSLYTGDRRRILPPLVFGAGVLLHLVRRGRYDVVHTASFPYFPLLAAALVRPLRRFRLVVDWHEIWSHDYWRGYLGRAGGWIGWSVQRLCARVPHRAFCFSRLHARRLEESGFRGSVTVLEGEYAGPLEPEPPGSAEPVVVFAGRHIPEKRVPALVRAFALVHAARPTLRCEIYGDGPERPRVLELVHELGLHASVEVPGFVDAERVEQALRSAGCMVLPSSREGYGLVVLEAAARGTPSVVVAGPDNAAVELVEDGRNGVVAASAEPDELAAAILRVLNAGYGLREATSEWFRANASRLSLESSLDAVLASYEGR
jgi:glycosyltransferase involved in cell wall biosynthesis